MSTTITPTTDDDDESNDSVFKDLIQRNPDVCNNCFRRIRKRRPINQVNVDGEAYELRDSTKKIVKDDNDYAQWADFCSGEEPTDGMVPYCDCGFIFPGGDKERPVWRIKFKTYAHRVVERFKEQSVSIDRDAFMTKAMELKAEPSNQQMDDTLLDWASDYAVDIESVRSGDSDFQNPG